MTPTDDQYWTDYDGLQHAKHALLNRYLGGWYPILSSWYGRVLYIDCHAGRGRHQSGQEGSPILALKRLLEHREKDRILSSTEVHFVFFEIDQINYDELCSEVDALGTLPKNVYVHPYQEDYEAYLRGLIAELKSHGQQMAPAFAFVDPYGFKIPMDLLNQLLAFPRCELLINFMFRYVDMAIRIPDQSTNMDELFGTHEWRKLVDIHDYKTRVKQTIRLYAEQLSAQYVTTMKKKKKNNAVKYVLIHATNHQKGRELMKGTLWAVTPDGTFTAHELHTPEQLVLLAPEPDLRLLKNNLSREFAGQTIRMEQLYEWLLDTLYLRKHLHQILREMRKEGMALFSDYDGSFAFKKNPCVEIKMITS